METDKSIVPKVVEALVSPEEAEAQWKRFEALKQKLLFKEDYQEIAGKAFIKRSGFRKIAVFFGISDRIIQEERIDRPDKTFVWRIVVEAIAPNGRTSIGVGACDSKERKFAHEEHDVYATAHTRAKSRAISDMIAGGIVSAEEIEAEPQPAPRTVGGGPAREVPQGPEAWAGLGWAPDDQYPENGWIYIDTPGAEGLLAEATKAVQTGTTLEAVMGDKKYRIRPDAKYIRRYLVKEAGQK